MAGGDAGFDDRWVSVVQYSNELFSILDDEMGTEAVFPSVRWLLGFEPEEIVGRHDLRLVHPDDTEVVRTAFGLAVGRPGASGRAEFRLRHKNGSWRWFDGTFTNRTDDPEIRGIVSRLQDVTDRRLAEAEVRDSEQRLRALLQNADGITAVMDSHFRVQWASPGAGRLWGLTDEEFVNSTTERRIHPDDIRRMAGQYLKVAETPGATARAESRIQHADGSWRWYESVYTNCFDDPSVNGIVVNTRDITERALAERALRSSEERLEHQATHDSLTDLPNRARFLERTDEALEAADAGGSVVAVLFLDLDHFQVVNDSLGHAYGDWLLVAVAERLTATLPPSGTVARFGGDEFIVLSEDLLHAGQVEDLADQLLRSFDAPFVIDGMTAYLNASIGIAVHDARTDEPATAIDLVRDADAATYQAKDRGRGRHALFDDALRTRAIERHLLQNGLRRAVEDEQFVVHYQPIVDLRDAFSDDGLEPAQIAGVESLVRWNHPERGLLAPGTFIGPAEENGLIVPIGRSVLADACRFWSGISTGSPGPQLPFLSVNLSARQLADPALLEDVTAVLQATGFAAERLHLEITESALMVDPTSSMTTLGLLKALGIRIAVDDFGTGYSSFDYLRRFPVDSLKIDKTFVDGIVGDERERALVEGMVQLGHTLGMTVVAEGVEDRDQLEVLRELGCDLAQGFLLARPMPGARLRELTASRV